MARQGCHCERRFLRVVNVLMLPNVPDDLHRVVAPRDEKPGDFCTPVKRAHRLLMELQFSIGRFPQVKDVYVAIRAGGCDHVFEQRMPLDLHDPVVVRAH